MGLVAWFARNGTYLRSSPKRHSNAVAGAPVFSSRICTEAVFPAKISGDLRKQPMIFVRQPLAKYFGF